MPLHLVKVRPERGEAKQQPVQATERDGDSGGVTEAGAEDPQPARLAARIPWAEVAARLDNGEPEWKIARSIATRLRVNRYRVEKAFRLAARREWDRESEPGDPGSAQNLPERKPCRRYLTSAQLKCLRAFAKLSQELGRAPTKREVCRELGVSANGDTVSEHLGQLTFKGYLEEVQALTVVGRRLTQLGTNEALKVEEHS